MLSIFGDFERACEERNAAIDRLAAGYVRRGMAPWVAIGKAAREVSERGRAKVANGLDVPPRCVAARVVHTNSGGPRHAG